MAGREIPRTIVHDLIGLLFDDGTPSSTDTLLLVNPTPIVADELDDYYRSEITASVPDTTVVHHPSLDREGYDWSESDYRTLETDFLIPRKDFGDEFDYILCLPNELHLENLSPEQRKDLATNFSTQTVESETAHTSVLHFEQVLKYLNGNGRGTLLAGSDFRARKEVGVLSDQLYFSIDHIDVYDSGATPGISESKAATLVTDSGYDADHTGFTYNPEHFESLLGQHVDSERPFEVAAVMTNDPVGYDLHDSTVETYFDLHYRDFDAALVFEDSEQRAGLRGYISRQELKSGRGDTLHDQFDTLGSEILLDPGARMENLIQSLARNRFQFVGSSEEVQGIVTRFDLNRLPVYLHLFDCFSEFEIGLRNLIRDELPDWEDKTSVYVSSQGEDDIYHDKLAMAGLKNLVDIVVEAELETQIRRDIRGYTVDLADLVDLRNMVAHYNPIIHTMGGSSEHDDQRDASELWQEYRLLRDSIEGLETG